MAYNARWVLERRRGRLSNSRASSPSEGVGGEGEHEQQHEHHRRTEGGVAASAMAVAASRRSDVRGWVAMVMHQGGASEGVQCGWVP